MIFNTDVLVCPAAVETHCNASLPNVPLCNETHCMRLYCPASASDAPVNRRPIAMVETHCMRLLFLIPHLHPMRPSAGDAAMVETHCMRLLFFIPHLHPMRPSTGDAAMVETHCMRLLSACASDAPVRSETHCNARDETHRNASLQLACHCHVKSAIEDS